MLSYRKKILLAFTASLSIASLTLYYFFPSSSSNTLPTYDVKIVFAHNEKIKEILVPYLQKEFKKKFNANLRVECVKHGSQGTNIKVVEAKFKKNKGITSGYDIVFGGGEIIFYTLEKNDRLLPLHLSEELKKNIPNQIAGTLLHGKKWVAASLSTFGMIYNKPLFKKLHLPIPTSWKDLANIKLFNKVISVNPCLSNNIWTIYAMILQKYGWNQGWQILTKIAANSVVFLDKSSNASSSVAQGIGLIAPTNDFYAQGTTHMHGSENLGFILPLQQTILNTDAIALLKGCNIKVAQFCIECILSPKFQSLLMLKKGASHGPKNYTIGRIAVNKKAYEKEKSAIGSVINPFKVAKSQFMQFDLHKAIKQYHTVSILFKAYLITPHKKLKKAWKLVIENGCTPEDIHYLTHPPFTEKQIEEFAKLCKNTLTRKKMMIAWTNQAIARYQYIIDKYET